MLGKPRTSGWWPADEMDFIRSIPEFAVEHGYEPHDLLSGYLSSIPKRKNWGRYIRENDVLEFIKEAQNQLRKIKSIT